MSAFIRGIVFRIIIALVALGGISATRLSAQVAPEAFHWVDVHSDAEVDVVGWVTRSLAGEKWTAIREIGVEYDAALVVGTLRKSPQALPVTDTFSIWSVSLTTHAITPIVQGTNLRFVDWLRFGVGREPELAAEYDDCSQCLATTYFTTFYFDPALHAWSARWIVNGKAAPIWMASSVAEGTWTQAFGVMGDADGNGVSLGTWSHFDAGEGKPPEDFFYLYSVAAGSNIDSSSRLTGKPADMFKERLCRGESLVPGLGRGQDASPCKVMAKPVPKPTVTPPANNHGRSTPLVPKR